MLRHSVASKYGTGLILTALLLLAIGRLQPATADITSARSLDSSIVESRAYTAEDSEALLRMLEAPVAPASAGKASAFESASAFGRHDVALLQEGPRSNAALTLRPDSAKFEAWDLRGGTIVPEPATALLMGAGLAALAAFRGLRDKEGTD